MLFRSLYTNAGEQLLPISGDGSGERQKDKGTSALDLLRQSGNLTDYKVYICPSSTDKAEGSTKPLSIGTVSYAYIPGLDATSPGDSGVAADGYESKTSGVVYNHDKFGNILYADGHVTPSTGTTSSNWISKANWLVKVEDDNAPIAVDGTWLSTSENGPAKN